MRLLSVAAAALLLCALLAGCAGGSDPPIDDLPGLKVDSTTGGIRGVVVDGAITPVSGAKVALANNGPATTTDRAGLFTFTGLKPGDYFLTVAKPGYTTVQQAVTVKAGEAAPPIVKVQVERVAGLQPYLEVHKLNGFYECAFALGIPDVTPVITDQCDFVPRTAHDEANGTVPYPAPRNVIQGTNTLTFDVGTDTLSIIQEAFWSDETVPDMMITLSSTPIDNSCDCSDRDYLEVIQPSPTYGRLDANEKGGGLPLGERVAARGFLNWNGPATATNLEFTVITSLFHNYKAPDGWTFETQDNYPVG